MVLFSGSFSNLIRLEFLAIVGKAFRHGDIENTLLELIKSTGGNGGGGGGLLGFATSVLHAASGGAKFSKDDVKRVYFVSCLVIESKLDTV